MRTVPKEAMQFKKLFHGGKSTYFLAIDKSKEGKTIPVELTGSLRTHWALLDKLNHGGSNVFMLINTVDGNQRNSKHVTKVNALFIDYDNGDWSAQDLDTLQAKFPVPPHMVVESSPGNIHAYWLVKDVPLDKFKAIQRKLIAKYDSDPVIHDLSRVMRMPGTINWKRDKPFLVRIIHADDDAQPILLSDFLRGMFGTPDPAELHKGAEKTGRVAAPVPHHDDLVQRVNRALQVIPADDRQVWITVGMALHSHFGGAGLAMFNEWSSKSAKYDEQEAERQWNSFKPNGGITIRTLFWLARSQPKMLDINENNIPTLSNPLELAEHFAEASTPLIRHCEEENAWYAASNGKWVKSNKMAERVAINYLQAMKAAAAQADSDILRGFIERHQSPASARELLRAAESAPNLSVSSAVFDQAQNLIGVKLSDIPGAIERYAVIQLDQKKRRLATPDDMIIRVVGAAYDPAAKCPLWREFIAQVTVGDSDLAEFLQLATGYTLYGHTKEQVMFILIGHGGNGKGVFSRIIYNLIGDYSALMQSNLLKPGAINANNPSPALMKLKSKRLWVCSEMPKGMVLDEALTKQITGGDLLSSRQLYGDQVEFQPVGKLWLSVNNMPRVRHDDKGMWRRIVPIPFNAVFTGKFRDNDLEEKLKAELPGILNWALEGARRYAKKGKLGQPKASVEMLASLRRDVDTVGAWIKSRCVAAADSKLQSKVAYEDYCEAMKRERVPPLPQKDFNADLVRRGYQHKTGRSFNYFVGLIIKAD